MAIQPSGQQDALMSGLSCLNFGVQQGAILDATVSGANTYATLRARIVINLNALPGSENAQLAFRVLNGLDQANIAGVLTDARLNGLTTVQGVRNLFGVDDPRLAGDPNIVKGPYRGSLASQ